MFRRTLTRILSIAFVAYLVIPVGATQTGSIHVETTGGTVALYQVGEINGQSFRLWEEYGGGYVEHTDILSSNLAAWLYEQVKNGQIKATDIYGDAAFDMLNPGLYLLSQPSTPSGQDAFEPFLIAIPWDGYVWDIDLNLEQLPRTGENTMSAIWIYTMLISAAGIVIFMHNRKKIRI